MFRQAAVAWGSVYYASFLRDQFGLSLPSTALFSLIGAILFAVALIVGGYFVNRIGRKRQLVSTLVVSCLLLIPIAVLNDLSSIIILSWVGGFIFFMSFPATTSLILEQAPAARGTMMSMSTIFVTFGRGLGTALGGIVLILSGWTGLILTFATLQLTAAAIYLFLTKDPCRT